MADFNQQYKYTDFINRYKYEVPGLSKRLSLIKTELENNISDLITMVEEDEPDKKALENVCQLILENTKELETIINY